MTRHQRHFDRFHELSASENWKPLTEHGYRLCKAFVMGLGAVAVLGLLAELLALVEAVMPK